METQPGNAIDFDPRADYKKEVMEAAEKPIASPDQVENRFQAASPERLEQVDDKKIEELHAQLAAKAVTEEKAPVQNAPRSPASQEKVTKGEWAGAIGSIGAAIGLGTISVPAIASDLATGAITNYTTAAPAIYLGSATALAVIVSGVVTYQIAQKLKARRA
jgi:hypothetical protein